MDYSRPFDWGDLFCGPDFPREVLNFFQATGHSTADVSLIVAEDILHCIYSEFNFNSYFDKHERLSFSRIISLAYLFALDSDVFDNPRSLKVRYYAVVIEAQKGVRTETANTILTAFAKNTTDHIVIMFRHENMCMLAFSKNSGNMCFFSDWFEDAETQEVLDKADIANMSLSNSDEFFLDFAFMTSRSYYTHPISRDYARSEWCYIETMFGEEDYSRPSIKEFVDEIMNADLRKYGDDYIEIPQTDIYQADTLADSDFDFDLLELELDEMIAAEAFGMDEDEEIDEENEDYDDDSERIDIDNIPSEILNDPVKLLEWLKKANTNDENTLDESW